MDKNYAYKVAYNNGYIKGREDALKELHEPFMALINKFNEYVETISGEETFMALIDKFNEYIEVVPEEETE